MRGELLLGGCQGGGGGGLLCGCQEGGGGELLLGKWEVGGGEGLLSGCFLCPDLLRSDAKHPEPQPFMQTR